MQYNVAQLLKDPVGSTRSYGIDEPVGTANSTIAASPKGRVFLMRTDKGVWVKANLEVGQLAVCGRCLESFLRPLSVVIEEEYFPTFDVTTGQSLRRAKDDTSFIIDQRHMLDLGEALRQYAITDQPMNPVCRTDCLGLCPVCGTNKNETICLCREGVFDPRWTPLRELGKTTPR